MVCKTCGGHGIMVSEFCGETTNPSLCPDCLENGTCPRCDGKMVLIEETQSYHCPHCGWDEETEFRTEKEKS